MKALLVWLLVCIQRSLLPVGNTLYWGCVMAFVVFLPCLCCCAVSPWLCNCKRQSALGLLFTNPSNLCPSFFLLSVGFSTNCVFLGAQNGPKPGVFEPRAGQMWVWRGSGCSVNALSLVQDHPRPIWSATAVSVCYPVQKRCNDPSDEKARGLELQITWTAESQVYWRSVQALNFVRPPQTFPAFSDFREKPRRKIPQTAQSGQ